MTTKAETIAYLGLSFPQGIRVPRGALPKQEEALESMSNPQQPGTKMWSESVRKPIIVFVCVSTVVWGGCRPAEQRGTDFRLSETQALDLQSKCSAMGKQILENNAVGSSLSQDEISRYSPSDNRCYVRLTVQSADPGTPYERYIRDETLFDGQTAEMLASTSREGSKGHAYVFDESTQKMVKNQMTQPADEVEQLMNRFMHTERKP